MEVWHPRALRAHWSRSGGSFIRDARPKQVLHTTEGGPTFVPDLRPDVSQRRYFGHEFWPHATIARVRGTATIVQHGPIDVSARTLRNLGPVETNRARAVQVEMAWKAENAVDLPDDLIAATGDWVGWVARQHGTGFALPDGGFHAYPPPIKLGTEPWRREGRAWLDFTGILGHQHVAGGNDHGDPGDLPIGRILERATALWFPTGRIRAPVREEDPFMALTDEEQREILTAARELRRLPTPADGTLAWAILHTHHLVGMLAAQTPSAAFTAADVAEMILSALPPELAAEVADELGRRVDIRAGRTPRGDGAAPPPRGGGR